MESCIVTVYMDMAEGCFGLKLTYNFWLVNALKMGALPLANQQTSVHEVNSLSFKMRVLSIEPTVDDSQLIY